MKPPTITSLENNIRALVRGRGYTRASYWIDTPENPAGRYLRSVAIKTLLAGGEVTVDYGYFGKPHRNGERQTITLGDVS